MQIKHWQQSGKPQQKSQKTPRRLQQEQARFKALSKKLKDESSD